LMFRNTDGERQGEHRDDIASHLSRGASSVSRQPTRIVRRPVETLPRLPSATPAHVIRVALTQRRAIAGHAEHWPCHHVPAKAAHVVAVPRAPRCRGFVGRGEKGPWDLLLAGF
jgi:hypothetical protein